MGILRPPYELPTPISVLMGLLTAVFEGPVPPSDSYMPCSALSGSSLPYTHSTFAPCPKPSFTGARGFDACGGDHCEDLLFWPVWKLLLVKLLLACSLFVWSSLAWASLKETYAAAYLLEALSTDYSSELPCRKWQILLATS